MGKSSSHKVCGSSLFVSKDNEDLTGSRKPTFIRDSSLNPSKERNSRSHNQLIQAKPSGTRNVKDNPTVTELKKRKKMMI